jgi:serine/threonine protein kinase
MPARSIPHPNDQMLNAYRAGKLDVDSAKAVRQHLESCSDCRRRASEVTVASGLREVPEAARLNPSAPLVSSLAGLSMLAGANPAAAPLARSLPPGLAQLPDYEILRELGEGGMGVVYLAQNILMGRVEVLKVVSSRLADRTEVFDRFLGEIRNAAKLNHPNIVTAYSALRAGESLVLAMEYVDGLDLARLVKARGPMPVANVCNYIHQAATGLQHAHERGMVHRDIKPGNLMLARQGERAIIKVLDFGLAKLKSERTTDHALTVDGQMLGTPDFIAPEQIKNAKNADIRADVYSLGCTCYYLLTGRAPFRGDSLYEVLQAHHSSEAIRLNLARPDVPVELAAVVAKMMAKAPERRFQEPRHVAAALLPYFKKAAAATIERVADASLLVQNSAEPPVSTPTLPASAAGPEPIGRKRSAVPSKTDYSREIEVDHRGPESTTPGARAVHPRPRVLGKNWPIGVAASLFALIVLGVAIITIRGTDEQKITTSLVGDIMTVDTGKKGEGAPFENDLAGAAASATKSVLDLAPAPTDPLPVGTLWRGTSTILSRSWTNNTNNNPRPLWLTIKARESIYFKAVAESFRGYHDAGGTIEDGVIHWTVGSEEYSWEGKRVGNELLGTFRGTNWQGSSSGEFRLELADQPRPRGPTARIPPDGPARAAIVARGGEWTVHGSDLVKEGSGDGFVNFGDTNWTDYDLTYEACMSAGREGFGGGFRLADGNGYTLGIGDSDGMHKLAQWSNATRRATFIRSVPGTIHPGVWYSVKISLRGRNIRVALDDRELISAWDDFSSRGIVSLRFYNGAGRFRNIKVTAPDGTLLWEGPPDLP